MNDCDEVVRRVYEYAWGIDTRDWALHRSIFTDRIRTDFSSWNGQPATELAADEWVSNIQVLFTGLDATQHTMSNPLVDIDGDAARCRMYMQAEHVLVNEVGDAFFTIGGFYDDQLVRTDAGWRIRSVTLNVWWRRGNYHLMELAAERGRELLGLSGR